MTGIPDNGPDKDAAALIAALAARRPFGAPVALVVAHPDDEAVGLGGLLHLLPDLLVVHLTDGAPRDGEDAARAGFAGPAEYAAHRAGEAAAALRAAGIAPRHVMLGAPDQGAAGEAPRLLAALRGLLGGVSVVLTHPYEGGHPDHDTAAWLVRAAHPGPVVEMASYHAAPDGAWRVGVFNGDQGVALRLSEAEQATRRAMFAAHASQAGVLRLFADDTVRLRPAAPADFTHPPLPDPLLYERQGWSRFAAWRAAIGAAIGAAA